MTYRARTHSGRIGASGVLLALLFSVLAAGCAKAPDDATIKSQIQSRFYADQDLKTTNLQVVVTKGEVMLTGQVPTTELRNRAVQLAGAVKGVKVVEDRLTTAEPEGATAEASPPAAPTRQPPRPKRESRAANRTSPAPAPAPVETKPAPAPPSQPERASGPETAAAPTKPAQEAPKPEPATVTIPAGTHLLVRMIDSVDSSKAKTGQEFRASLDSPLVVKGKNVVPAGADVSIRLATAKSAGRMTGRSELELQLVKMVTRGRTYPLVSNVYSAKGKSRGEDTAKKVGVGAAVGAVIGAIAGGGKGAAIGAAAGAGTGTAIQLATRGQQVKVPSETLLDFELQKPVTVTTTPTQP
jgi:hypothetical protein